MEQQWLENKEKLEPHLQADHLPVLLSGLLIHSGKVCYICAIVHIRCKMLCHISLIIFLGFYFYYLDLFQTRYVYN